MHRIRCLLRYGIAAALLATGVAGVEGQQPDTSRAGRIPSDFQVPPEARGIQPGDTAAIRRLAEERLGRPITQAEILYQLKSSGLSREEARARLESMGLDPALADTYFDVIEERQGEQAGRTAARDSLSADSAQARLARADSAAEARLEIFGQSLFRLATTQFEPLRAGPVPPDYRIGPQDELVIVLTGDVELQHRVPVTTNGYIIVPDAGQVYVSGLTVAQAHERLAGRLARLYQGLNRGPESTTHMELSLGQLRMSQVYLVGEVARPGAVQVNGLATVFNALYQAGGPTQAGSFRRIEVRRGGELVNTLDLYDYLLKGDSRNDIRLENNDIVYTPLAGGRVSVKGAVRRPAIYEIREGETLHDVLAFAGGLEAAAYARRIQIDRILAPSERVPGVDRVFLDVDAASFAEGEAVPVRDGDVIEVFPVSEERRRNVALGGEVRRPGTYEWAPGMTLWELLDRAQGLNREAYTARAHIFRLDEENGTRSLIAAPLVTTEDGRPLSDVVLADRDSVVVYSRKELRTDRQVAISGFVKKPGEYRLTQGMGLKDLILAAGGFEHGAYVLEAEVARQPDMLTRSDTTALVYRVPLDAAGAIDSGSGANERRSALVDPAGIPMWVPDGNEFTLRHGDQVFIRPAPGYEKPRSIVITGEVASPGKHTLRSRQERLVDLLQRAGGLTQEAFPSGFQLVRRGELVGTDLEQALKDPTSRYNIALEAGDSLNVPKRDPTVLVTGAVGYETRVLYEPGKGVDYYISQAGGYTDKADKDRLSVTYQNGERATADKKLLFLSMSPDPRPGATINVPEKPPSEIGGFDWDRFLSRTTALASTLLTLKLAIDQLSK